MAAATAGRSATGRSHDDRGRRGAELGQDLGQRRDRALAEPDPHREMERERLDHDPASATGPAVRVAQGAGRA